MKHLLLLIAFMSHLMAYSFFDKESGEVFATYTHYIEQRMTLNAKIIDV